MCALARVDSRQQYVISLIHCCCLSFCYTVVVQQHARNSSTGNLPVLHSNCTAVCSPVNHATGRLKDSTGLSTQTGSTQRRRHQAVYRIHLCSLYLHSRTNKSALLSLLLTHRRCPSATKPPTLAQQRSLSHGLRIVSWRYSSEGANVGTNTNI